MKDFFYFIGEILWGSMMIYLLIGAGIWFTIRTKFVQFHIKLLRSTLTGSTIVRPHGITAFQALCTSLAARVGSGNLAGVALAITIGGPGAIFWMWIAAIIGMATSFAECSLAQLYKVQDAEGNFRGGPAWYMEQGLGLRWMGVLFSIFLLLAFGLIFNSVQANSIARALYHSFHIPHLVTGIAIALLTSLVIIRGMRGIARLSQWLVPFMTLLWISTGLIISVLHIDLLPDVLSLVFHSAFGWQEAAAGTMGYTLSQALATGFQRAMFSNEAGMGSTPNAAAAAASWPPHPASQGIMQMFSVFFDTAVICTSTAMIILLSGKPIATLTEQQSGIVLTQQALVSFTGEWGSVLLSVVVSLFGFTSIIANYAYAENNLFFLNQATSRNRRILRLMTLLMVIIGSVASLTVVWQLADIIMALMAITNLVAILLLSPVVRNIASDYLRQRRLGIQPVFDPKRFPDLEQQIAPGIWQKSGTD